MHMALIAKIVHKLPVLWIVVLLQTAIALTGLGYIATSEVDADRQSIRSERYSFAGHARQAALAAEVFIDRVAEEVRARPALTGSMKHLPTAGPPRWASCPRFGRSTW